MSVLVVQIPPRKRQGPQGASAAEAGGRLDANAASPPGQWFWVKTDNGLSAQSQGRSAPADLPPSEAVVAVLSESDVSWHRLVIPKAPAAKMRAALVGSLEEFVLSDPEQLHVALAPEAEPGAKAWVAVVDKPWLSQLLTHFERQGVMIDRVVPSLWPGEKASGHFYDASPAGATPEPGLAMADANGIACLPLAGTLARALLPPASITAMRWSAPSAVAAAAERWLGHPVMPSSPADQLMAAAQSVWNLRQFDFVPRRRGSLALRDAWRRFMRPTWRPVRWGLAGLVAVQVLGLNVWAWSLQQSMDERRQAQAQLLKQAHPQVRLVRDAPLQMERETDLLRAAAGKPGANDLETLLAMASGAWPEAQGPMQNLRFQTGQLSLAAPTWTPEDIRQFSERLRPAGWAVASQNGRVNITRSTTP